MTTGERRPRKFRKTWNLWHLTAFALIPLGAAVAFWGMETQGGTKFNVFMIVAQVLVVLAILCLMRGYKRKLAAAVARSADGTAPPTATFRLKQGNTLGRRAMLDRGLGGQHAQQRHSDHNSSIASRDARSQEPGASHGSGKVVRDLRSIVSATSSCRTTGATSMTETRGPSSSHRCCGRWSCTCRRIVFQTSVIRTEARRGPATSFSIFPAIQAVHPEVAGRRLFVRGYGKLFRISMVLKHRSTVSW
jgi:hypothetical protein